MKGEMDGACGTYGGGELYISGLVGKRERKRPHVMSRRRWKDNIKIDLYKMCRSVDWYDLAQVRDRWPALVNAVMNFRVP
jgi:hypothetical protein